MFSLLLQPFKRMFNFSGRAQRAEFWLFFLLILFLYTIAAIVINVELNDPILTKNLQPFIYDKLEPMFNLFTKIYDNKIVAENLVSSTVVITLLIMLSLPNFGIISYFIVIPFLSLVVRRLHDTDRSAWWILIFLLPLGNLIFVILLLLDGTEGKNRFGPDPKGRT